MSNDVASLSRTTSNLSDLSLEEADLRIRDFQTDQVYVLRYPWYDDPNLPFFKSIGFGGRFQLQPITIKAKLRGATQRDLRHIRELPLTLEFRNQLIECSFAGSCSQYQLEESFRAEESDVLVPAPHGNGYETLTHQHVNTCAFSMRVRKLRAVKDGRLLIDIDIDEVKCEVNSP